MDDLQFDALASGNMPIGGRSFQQSGEIRAWV